RSGDDLGARRRHRGADQHPCNRRRAAGRRAGEARGGARERRLWSDARVAGARPRRRARAEDARDVLDVHDERVSLRRDERSAAMTFALGFRVKSGRAVAVALGETAASPELLVNTVVALGDPAVPETKQPYHAGFGTARDDPESVERLVVIVRRCARA